MATWGKEPGESLKLKQLKTLIDERVSSVFVNFSSKKDGLEKEGMVFLANSPLFTLCRCLYISRLKIMSDVTKLNNLFDYVLLQVIESIVVQSFKFSLLPSLNH